MKFKPSVLAFSKPSSAHKSATIFLKGRTRSLALLGATVVLGFGISGAQGAIKYWDTAAGAGNGVGGSGSLTAQTTARFSDSATGDATLSAAVTADGGIFQGTAGTVTFDSSFGLASATFNVTGYTLATSGIATRIFTAPITLANNVTLSLSPIAAAAITVSSITGGTASSLTVGGSNSAAADTTRINLASGATIANSSPITISTSGTLGISGFVASSGTSTINASITNNSGVTTMLGATGGDTLNIGGIVSGSAGVRYSAGTSGGAGTINLNAAGNYTGATQFNGLASTGVVKLGIDDAISTTSAVIMGFSNTFGQRLDLNGRNQTIASLASNTGGTGSIINSAVGTGTSILTINGSATTSFGLVIADGATAKTALTRAGTGTTTLTAANTYTGATTIKGGTLALGSAGTLASINLIVGDAGSSGAILDTTAKTGFTIASNQTLSGIGTVNVGAEKTLAVNGGRHSAGNIGTAGGVGTQAVTGNLNYSSSIFDWDLSPTVSSPDPGVFANDGAYDKVTATGTVTGGTSVFNIVLGSGKAFSDDFWNTNKSWTNIFSASSAPNLAAIFANFGGSGVSSTGLVTDQGQFSFTSSTLNFTAVPEPTSALAGLLLGAGLLRRRRVA